MKYPGTHPHPPPGADLRPSLEKRRGVLWHRSIIAKPFCPLLSGEGIWGEVLINTISRNSSPPPSLEKRRGVLWHPSIIAKPFSPLLSGEGIWGEVLLPEKDKYF